MSNSCLSTSVCIRWSYLMGSSLTWSKLFSKDRIQLPLFTRSLAAQHILAVVEFIFSFPFFFKKNIIIFLNKTFPTTVFPMCWDLPCVASLLVPYSSFAFHPHSFLFSVHKQSIALLFFFFFFLLSFNFICALHIQNQFGITHCKNYFRY